jgi:hypothetical protein
MSDWSATTSWALRAIIAVNFALTVWVLVGGWFDLMALLVGLEQEQVDPTDDGRVVTPVREDAHERRAD